MATEPIKPIVKDLQVHGGWLHFVDTEGMPASIKVSAIVGILQIQPVSENGDKLVPFTRIIFGDTSYLSVWNSRLEVLHALSIKDPGSMPKVPRKPRARS